MTAWIVPAVAGAFWLGLTFPPVGRGGWGLCLAGSALCAGAALTGPGRRGSPVEDLVPAGPRHRVLRAAGLMEPPARAPAGRAAARAACLLVGVAILGSGWSAVRRPAPGPLGALEGSPVTFHGVVRGDPRPSPFGWGVEVALTRVEGRPASVRAWVEGRDAPPAAQPGERVSGRGRVRGIRPGQGGFTDHLLTRGVVGMVEASEVRVDRGTGPVPLRIANAARQGLRRGAERALDGREAGLLLGLSIGDVATMDPEVEEDFRATGLGHLVAVSGSNVVMVLAPVLGLVALAGGGPWARTVAGGLTVVLFALITRWEPSVLRASVMAGMALLGTLAGRPRSTATVLGGAVLVLLVADPSLGAALGFQLSVAATAGLVALAGPVAGRMPWLPPPVALALGATVGAQVAVTPLLLLRFGVVPLAAIPANLLAVPLTAPALFLGLAASGLALAWPGAGRVVGAVAGIPLGMMSGVADVAAKASLPSLTSRGVVVPAAVGMAAVVLARRLRGARRPPRRLGVALAAALVVAGARPAPPGDLTVVFLDVGQGDAAVVRAPGGVTILVDAGPDHDHVATRLAALGVRRLDVVLASHGHADHVEGLPAVLARHRVGLLLDPGCPADSPSYAAFRRAAAAEGVPVRPVRGGTRYRVGGVSLDILGPDGCGLGEDGPNDDSLVVRVTSGGRSILFPGDAEGRAQQDLLDDGDPVRADVLKVPHHGGDTSLDAFFHAVDARVAVVSTGPNTYGHPVPGVLAALRGAGMRVMRTDQSGDITLRFTDRGIVVRSER